MKNRILALLILAISLGPVACHTQVSPTPPVSSCPAAGNNAYTPINAVGSTNPPTTALTYSDTPSAPSCYVVQGYLASGSQYSQWSNVAGPQAPGATGKVNLSWTCTAGAGQTCSGVQWVVSRVSAVTATAPAQPSMGAPTSAENPAPEPTIAKNGPVVKLKAAGL